MGTLSYFPNFASSRSSTTLPGDIYRVPEERPHILELQETASEGNNGYIVEGIIAYTRPVPLHIFMHEFYEFTWLIGTNPKLEVLPVRWLPSHLYITAMAFYMDRVDADFLKNLHGQRLQNLRA